MVGNILDRISGVSQPLARSAKAINNFVIDQSVETRTVIIDALRRIVDSKHGQDDSLKSFGLVEVPSKRVEEAVLGNLTFAGMQDRHEEVVEAFGEIFEWAYQDLNPARPRSNFTNWLREDNEMYWVNDKAGSGKSTLISHEQEMSYKSGVAIYQLLLEVSSSGTGSSISESRHEQFPFPSLDLSCCCYSLSCG